MKYLFRTGIVLWMTLAANFGAAQSRPATFQEVITVDVKPGHLREWTEYRAKIKEAATKLGVAQTFNLFHVTVGENRNRVYIVRPFEKWADMEGWTNEQQMLVNAFGETEGLAILQQGSATEEHRTSGVTRYLPDHSTNMDQYESAVAPMYQVIQTQVYAHASASYEAWLALVAKAQNADASRPPATRRFAVQGSSWLYTTSMPMQRLGDRDQQPGLGVSDFYGESAAGRLTDMVGDGVASRTWFIVHHHPNQSYSGASATSN